MKYTIRWTNNNVTYIFNMTWDSLGEVTRIVNNLNRANPKDSYEVIEKDE